MIHETAMKTFSDEEKDSFSKSHPEPSDSNYLDQKKELVVI